jgi:hypothetical protein
MMKDLQFTLNHRTLPHPTAALPRYQKAAQRHSHKTACPGSAEVQCRVQARRVYYGAVLEIKKEIPVRSVKMQVATTGNSARGFPGLLGLITECQPGV